MSCRILLELFEQTLLRGRCGRDNTGKIAYTPLSNSPYAYSLIGRYDVKGDNIILKVTLKQNKTVKYRFEQNGKKNELDKLAEEIVTRSKKLVGKDEK